MSARLIRCKQIVLALEFNPKDAKLAQMKSLILAFGVPEAEFPKAWTSIKKVWASKFNERAFLAVKKIGVRLDQVFMAVLIQKIVRARYAFVIHTANPTNGEENEVYVEACRGLGESLVSDMPGAALSFTVLKEPALQAAASHGQTVNACTVNSYPNKPIELVTGNGFIFRSDSNSEDLPGFAGAGLFDSYAMEDETVKRVSYSDDKIFNDSQFRGTFMKQVGQIGELIENAYDGAPQDIEGAYSEDGKYFVVQTRP